MRPTLNTNSRISFQTSSVPPITTILFSRTDGVSHTVPDLGGCPIRRRVGRLSTTAREFGRLRRWWFHRRRAPGLEAQPELSLTARPTSRVKDSRHSLYLPPWTARSVHGLQP